MKLEKAQKTLDHEKSKIGLPITSKLKKVESTVGRDFPKKETTKSSSKYFIYLALFTFIFFLGTIAIALYVNFSGENNQYSPDKILITTTASPTIDASSSAFFQVRLINKNPIPLQRAQLIVRYPDGVYIQKGSGIVHQQEFDIGRIEVNETVQKTLHPAVYGVFNEDKVITYELKYRTEGSSQPIVKESEYAFSIGDPSIRLSQVSNTTPVAGKRLTASFEIESNSNEELYNVQVVLKHPSGFLSDETPASETVWSVPTLNSNEKKEFIVSGVIRESQNISQSFFVKIFLQPAENSEKILLASSGKVFEIKPSFLETELRVENISSSEDVVVAHSEKIRGEVLWKNNATESLNDVEFYLNFKGTGLNVSSIQSNYGYYDEIKQRLVWTKSEIPAFESILPQEEGKFSFSFSVVPNRLEFAQKNKSVQVKLSAKVNRVSQTSAETLQGIHIANLKVSGFLQVSANTLYSTSEIKNTGPHPPKVKEETTYVLQYLIKNSGTDISDFTISFQVPRSVEVTGQYVGLLPKEISYNKETRVVLVKRDSIEAYGTKSSRVIEIQVKINPILNDVGATVTLARKGSYSGVDEFINSTERGEVKALNSWILVEGFSDNGKVRK